MEHDSSRSGYHEPEPGHAGLENEEDWGDDFPKTFSVNLIWAQACDKEGHDGAIGFKGGMPWHLPEDMKRFKELTVSHPVIMGRKTWESLSLKYRPLPNRDNIVVSHDSSYTAYVTQISMHVDADTYAPDVKGLVESGAWKVAEEGVWQGTTKGFDDIAGFRFITFERNHEE